MLQEERGISCLNLLHVSHPVHQLLSSESVIIPKVSCVCQNCVFSLPAVIIFFSGFPSVGATLLRLYTFNDCAIFKHPFT